MKGFLIKYSSVSGLDLIGKLSLAQDCNHLRLYSFWTRYKILAIYTALKAMMFISYFFSIYVYSILKNSIQTLIIFYYI